MAKAEKSKTKRILLWLVLTILLGGILYAAQDESGQANKHAADAGEIGGELEVASMDVIKPSKNPARKVNVSQDKKIDAKIKRIDGDYKRLLKKAQGEAASAGMVSEATRNAGIASAAQYKDACEERAVLWEKKDNQYQAALMRETGAARVNNAEMSFNNADRSRSKSYNAQLDKMAAARKAYFDNCKDDMTDSDRAAVKSTMTGRVDKIQGDISNLISNVTGLINQIQGLMAGGVSGVVGGCAKAAMTGESDPLTDLFQNVTGLLDMIQGMGGNAKAMMGEISTL